MNSATQASAPPSLANQHQCPKPPDILDFPWVGMPLPIECYSPLSQLLQESFQDSPNLASQLQIRMEHTVSSKSPVPTG